jgi:hypothetical protein
MKKIIAGLAGVLVLGFVSVGVASADSNGGWGRYGDGYGSADYSCRHLRHECDEERDGGYGGRACRVYEEQCGYSRCERLRHACHEEREGNGQYGACHFLHEECDER